MTSPTFSELAALVERLTGKCRETDCLIFEAGHRLLTPERRGTIDGEPTGEYFDLNGNVLPERAPRYTESLDAAMTLVPEGIWYCLSGPHSVSGGLYLSGDRRFDMTMGIGDDRCDGKAATAANATTAAALRFRARASMEADRG